MVRPHPGAGAVSGLIFGPGPGGDYGKGLARREAERRFNLGLCQHCSRRAEEHRAVRALVGVLYACPTAFYLAPEELKP